MAFGPHQAEGKGMKQVIFGKHFIVGVELLFQLYIYNPIHKMDYNHLNPNWKNIHRTL